MIFERLPAMRMFLLCNIIGCVVFCASLASAMQIKKPKSCISCHEDTYKRGGNLPYVHSSFANKDCEKCHIKPEGTGSGSAWSVRNRPEVISRSDYLLEHIIFLRGLDKDAVYDIDIISRDMSGGQTTTKLKDVVLSQVRNIKTGDRTPPVISGVKSGPVTKGIFLTAVIEWDTDEPTTGFVEYGFAAEYGNRTAIDGALSRHHEASLSGLEQGKVYDYRILAEDISENRSVSTNLVLDTATIVSEAPSPDRSVTKWEVKQKPTVKRAEVFVLDSDLGLHVATAKAADVTVEYTKIRDFSTKDRESLSVSRKDDGLSKKERLHKPGFRTRKELCIDLCYECHPPAILGVSHPVGISPKDGRKIPKDMPTLEGSVITCVTCHWGHGSNLRYLARGKPDKAICDSCHSDYAR
ncbi:MAG: hypothetical protein BA868_00360 [Desulfobacterales bacterium C00003106]|nr:MAG: hypothetical protein BA868_00360 [Desulfobacterales bacterium C00003106]OEU57517.1 MAG: hypothetical protein BAW33_04475 [Desulfobacterales bacterium C00003104]